MSQDIYNSPYTPAEVDDAVAKRHAQNTDTALDTGGTHEITAEGILETAHHAIGLSYAIDLGTQGVRMAIDLRTDVHALQADVVTAQDTADAAVSDAATAQSTADGAVTDAAAAQLTADDAQSDATLALLQTVALHYATDVATVSAR